MNHALVTVIFIATFTIDVHITWINFTVTINTRFISAALVFNCIHYHFSFNVDSANFVVKSILYIHVVVLALIAFVSELLEKVETSYRVNFIRFGFFVFDDVDFAESSSFDTIGHNSLIVDLTFKIVIS